MKHMLTCLILMCLSMGAYADRYDRYNGPDVNQSQNSTGIGYGGIGYGGKGGVGGAGGAGGDADSYSRSDAGGDADADADSTSVSGALSGSVSDSSSGGNSQDIMIQGDIQAASSAIAGQADECVNVLAAQSSDYGVSIGNSTGECKAALAAKRNFKLVTDLATIIPSIQDEELKTFLEGKQKEALLAAIDYTELANPSAFKVYLSGTREVLTDGVISAGMIALLLLI